MTCNRNYASRTTIASFAERKKDAKKDIIVNTIEEVLRS